MGRFAVKMLVVVALIWGAWWYFATGGLQNRVNAWLEERRVAGWQAEVNDLSRTGFPGRIGARLNDLRLDDPATQIRLDIPQVTLSTPIYWPGHASLRLPSEPVTLSTPQGILTVTTSGADASLRLRPGTSLQLEAMRTQSSDIAIELVEGRVFAVEAFTANVEQTEMPDTYDINFTAAGFEPGSVVRDALRLPAAWPTTFETLLAEMTVMFERPWDRTALEESRPQPQRITINRVEAVWADLRISLAANLTVAAGGVLTGSINLQAENWQRMLDLATASGGLPTDLRPQMESGITLLSGLSGGGDTLDLDITVEDGRMRIGFIPLGAAPRVVIH